MLIGSIFPFGKKREFRTRRNQEMPVKPTALFTRTFRLLLVKGVLSSLAASDEPEHRTLAETGGLGT